MSLVKKKKKEAPSFNFDRTKKCKEEDHLVSIFDEGKLRKNWEDNWQGTEKERIKKSIYSSRTKVNACLDPSNGRTLENKSFPANSSVGNCAYRLVPNEKFIGTREKPNGKTSDDGESIRRPTATTFLPPSQQKQYSKIHFRFLSALQSTPMNDEHNEWNWSR